MQITDPILEESDQTLPLPLRNSLRSASIWMRVLFGVLATVLILSTLALYSQWNGLRYIRGFSSIEESEFYGDLYAMYRNQLITSLIFWLFGCFLALNLLLSVLSYARAGRTGSTEDWEKGLRRERLFWWSIPVLVALGLAFIFMLNRMAY